MVGLQAPLCEQGKKLAQATRLWASGQLDTSNQDDEEDEYASALVALGLQAEEDDAPQTGADTFYLWPETVGVWSVWHRIQTLWRVGTSGREGLDYAGLCAYLREVERIKPRKFAEAFACMQAMERAALEEWAKQREKNK